MKRTVLLLLLAGVACVFSAALYVLASSPDETAEFYFTRLAYSENGYRGWGGLTTAPGFRCPEFGGSNFFPPQGVGWSMDYPGADCKFMGGIHRLTGLRVYSNPNVLGIMDDELFGYPYAYIVEPGGMNLTEREAVRLREYLVRGGFIHVDDFWGRAELANFEWQMLKVFPERRLQPIPLSHEIFRTFFDIESLIQVPGQQAGCSGGPTWEVWDDTEPRVYGIADDNGRLMVVVTYNSDFGDAWEYMDLPCYPTRYSGQAYKLGMNFMVYAMTH